MQTRTSPKSPATSGQRQITLAEWCTTVLSWEDVRKPCLDHSGTDDQGQRDTPATATERTNKASPSVLSDPLGAAQTARGKGRGEERAKYSISWWPPRYQRTWKILPACDCISYLQIFIHTSSCLTLTTGRGARGISFTHEGSKMWSKKNPKIIQLTSQHHRQRPSLLQHSAGPEVSNFLNVISSLSFYFAGREVLQRDLPSFLWFTAPNTYDGQGWPGQQLILSLPRRWQEPGSSAFTCSKDSHQQETRTEVQVELRHLSPPWMLGHSHHLSQQIYCFLGWSVVLNWVLRSEEKGCDYSAKDLNSVVEKHSII